MIATLERTEQSIDSSKKVNNDDVLTQTNQEDVSTQDPSINLPSFISKEEYQQMREAGDASMASIPGAVKAEHLQPFKIISGLNGFTGEETFTFPQADKSVKRGDVVVQPEEVFDYYSSDVIELHKHANPDIQFAISAEMINTKAQYVMEVGKIYDLPNLADPQNALKHWNAVHSHREQKMSSKSK